MKKLLIVAVLLFSFIANAQETTEKKVRDSLIIYSLDAASINEVAKFSKKKNTLLYTFGIWCEPCRLHLPTAINLAKEYDLDLFVVIVDSEKSKLADMASDYLYQFGKEFNIGVLSDETYGLKTKKRNKQFVTEMTPPQFENINDFSKYILLNKEGEVIMVTAYKDNKGNDWRDDTKMVNERIVPLLTKKEAGL
ncbi:hypothetical protein R1T16_09475 [Flavobacterium sp. DG1-102-2]|uniref:hypothetical protein n=1 Tax=Flavobacterium sp. DG1-102-2 TaxID=3081663 RepID=UPI00294926AC|nr:hypothetical protein [Flavobacterium sp. DG1-102-2]MDV6168653.1 hypothetical protein [Flavobacterium sp. DG1-102-2]